MTQNKRTRSEAEKRPKYKKGRFKARNKGRKGKHTRPPKLSPYNAF